LWDKKSGLRWINAALASAGVDIGTHVLFSANAVSADGKIVVGDGYPADGDFQGWIARLP
jgi:hypothetical protein